MLMENRRTTLKARFMLALKRVDLTQADVAREMGINPQNITHWLNRESIPAAKLFRLCEVLQCSAQWLLSGREDMPGETATHQLLDPRRLGKVPLISSVQAGDPGLAVDLLAPDEAEDWLYCNATHSDQAYALRVEGDSMTAPYGKSYPPGSIIFVDPEQRGAIELGEPIVAKISGRDGVTFKVLARDDGRAFLKPLNPQYPPLTEEFRPLGKVIGKWEA